MSSRCHKGFALIELMIVVTLIGIGAAIAIPNFQVYRDRATLEEYQKNHGVVTNKTADTIRREAQVPRISEAKLSDGTVCGIYNGQLSCGCKK